MKFFKRRRGGATFIPGGASIPDFRVVNSNINLNNITWLTLELSDDCLYPPSTCYSEPEKKVRFAVQDDIIEEIYEETFLVDDDIPYGN